MAIAMIPAPAVEDLTTLIKGDHLGEVAEMVVISRETVGGWGGDR